MLSNWTYHIEKKHMQAQQCVRELLLCRTIVFTLVWQPWHITEAEFGPTGGAVVAFKKNIDSKLEHNEICDNSSEELTWRQHCYWLYGDWGTIIWRWCTRRTIGIWGIWYCICTHNSRTPELRICYLMYKFLEFQLVALQSTNQNVERNWYVE